MNMKSLKWLVWLALVGLLFIEQGPFGSVMAAETGQVTIWVDGVDTTQFPQVVVYVHVWGSDGLPITGLRVEDFQLQEDGGPPFAPEDAVEDSSAPLQVVLVLDVSTSMAGQPLADAKAAAARFLDRLGPGDQAALIAFSSPVDPDPRRLDGKREMGFTRDLARIYEAIEGLESGGGTALYHAVQKAVGLAATRPLGHRAVLLLTDGRNDPPHVGDPDAPIVLARKHRVPVFVIGLGQDIDEPYLQRLAQETGGLFRKTPHSAELARLFRDMATLLKTQYRLTYISRLEPDGQRHVLRVTVHTPIGIGTTAGEDVVFGPLPQVRPTATSARPTETPTSPMMTPTVTPASGNLPTPTSIPMGEGFNPLPWVGFLGIALLVALFLVGAARARRRPVKEVCAQCGYDLTGYAGSCPVCGSTRRLHQG